MAATRVSQYIRDFYNIHEIFIKKFGGPRERHRHVAGLGRQPTAWAAFPPYSAAEWCEMQIPGLEEEIEPSARR